METLKGLVDFLCTYPTWARISMVICFFVMMSSIVLAPVFRTPASRSTAVMLEADRRLAVRLATQPGFERHTYPVLGLGLLTPAAWSVEDAAAKFAGGEVDLVKRYEDTKAIVGVKLRITAVQKNYINDPKAEQDNQLDVLKRIDPKVDVGDVVIVGRNGKLFCYRQSTGNRIGDTRMYWVRLIPEVKLEIIAFIYKDPPDNNEFWKEVETIVASLVFDEESFHSRQKRIADSER